MARPQPNLAHGAVMGGRASRDKGNRRERAIVKYFQNLGFAAERVPLSGAAGGSYLGDLTIPVCNVDRVVEVKSRRDGFRELYKWLEARDLLIVCADRKEPLVILPLKLAAEIAAKADNRAGRTPGTSQTEQ
jgi:Holliday junction resolvase